MNWDILDFAAMGGMIAVLGAVIVLVVNRATTHLYRAATMVTGCTAFLLMWVNGAVGIIGSSANDANMMYLGVAGIAVFGGLFSAFEASRMSKVMVITAIAQAVVPVIAMTGLVGSGGAMSMDVAMMTGMFGGLWLLASLLYGAASRSSAAA